MGVVFTLTLAHPAIILGFRVSQRLRVYGVSYGVGEGFK